MRVVLRVVWVAFIVVLSCLMANESALTAIHPVTIRRAAIKAPRFTQQNLTRPSGIETPKMATVAPASA